MFRLSERATLDHPASVVWRYLVAFEQVPLWEGGVVEVRQVTPGPPQIGAEMFARRIYGGRESRLSGSITAFEDGRSATMQLAGGPLAEAYVQYTVEPLDDSRSIVTYSAWGSLVGPLRILHPILPALGRSQTRKNLAKLARRIDSGTPPTSDVDAG